MKGTQGPKDKAGRPSLRTALKLLLPIAAIVSVLAACSTGPAPTPSSSEPKEPPRAEVPAPAREHNPLLVRKGPGSSLPLHLGYIPEGSGVPATLLPQAQGDVVVQMQALLISATSSPEVEPSLGAWQELLEQVGMPYQWVVASDPQWTPEALAQYLVGPDGVGRFQAVVLSTNNLVYDAGGGQYPSAFGGEEWAVLQAYERAYGVRQVALYGYPSYPWGSPDNYGVVPSNGVGMSDYQVIPTAEGLGIFTDIDESSLIFVDESYGYPSTLSPGGNATPLLVDSDGNVWATLVTDDGRERIGLFFDNAAWANMPVAYTQQLGASLLRWASRGIHIGERRNSFQADVDDWFLETGRWNTTTHQIDEEEGTGFRLSAKDALSLRDQQDGLRALGGGIAQSFTWSMAFNGVGAEGQIPATCTESQDATLTYITRCLADDFWWVNHTWDHEYMDWIPGVGKNLNVAQVTSLLELNDALADSYGFGANYSRNSLVSGDISGLGWYDPLGPDHEPVVKVDHGLTYASPYFVQAARDTGHYYLASNMSTPSHEPDCWACGVYLTLDDNVHEPTLDVEVFLVPRWPTNIFATVATPAEVVDAYNMVYGEHGSDPNHFDHDLDYDEILDVDTDIALRHVLSGSPYPHYFHTPNAHEYEPGKSLLTDWATVLIGKYASMVNEPLLSHKNDDSAAYVRARTDFLAAGASGTWNRTTGKVTIRSANDGVVFLTGASLGAGSADITYNGRTISQRAFSAGQEVTIDYLGPAGQATAIGSFFAQPATIAAGGSTELHWAVFGPHSDISVRVKDGAVVGAGDRPATGQVAVDPSANTTYELVVTTPSGTLTKEATVTVVPAPAITLEADRTTITLGETVNLSWTVSGDHSEIQLLTVGEGGGVVAGGLEPVSNRDENPTADTTYQLAVTWLGGEALSEPIAITVTPTSIRPTITSFAAVPGAIAAGQSSTLSWTVTGDATGVSLRVKDGDPIEIAAGAASVVVTPEVTTTYELAVAWAGGESVTSQATVNVAPTATLIASPESIAFGGTTTLSWSVDGVYNAIDLQTSTGEVIEAGLQASGAFDLAPDATTTYHLRVEWAGETVVVPLEIVVVPTVDLSATPSDIVSGSSSTLAWNVQGGFTDITLNVVSGESLGSGLDATGTRDVTPTVMTEYELIVTYLGGEPIRRTQTVTVHAAPVPPVIESFSATPDVILNGQSAQLAWSVTGTVETISLRVGGADVYSDLASSGNQAVNPPATTTYELYVTWAGGGPVTRSTTVTVDPLPAPSVSFSANPDTIVSGGSSFLVWEVEGAYQSIALREQGGDTIDTGLGGSGSTLVEPTSTTTYELVVAWAGGADIVRPATVTVTEAPVRPTITSFTATPSTIEAGNHSLISWTVTGSATNVSLSVQGGAVLDANAPTAGERTVSPTTTTTYVLTAEWAGGEVTRTTTVTVTDPADPDPETFTLKLTLTGSGFGLVVSNPEGLACIDECVATFPAGTTVTLAPVALVGSDFAGFSGACTDGTCSIALDEDVEIGARFELRD